MLGLVRLVLLCQNTVEVIIEQLDQKKVLSNQAYEPEVTRFNLVMDTLLEFTFSYMTMP